MENHTDLLSEHPYSLIYKGPYNSQSPFELNYINRYAHEANTTKKRSDSLDVPHDSDYHLVYSSNGAMTITTPETEYIVPEYSFLIYKPTGLQIHTQDANSSYVHCIFSGTYVKTFLSGLDLKLNTIYKLTPKHTSADDILYFNKQCEYIALEQKKKELYYNQKKTSLFLSFLVDCSRHIHLYNPTSIDTQMDLITKYIKNNICKPIDINELISMCHLSRSRFYHAFKKYTGTSPIGFQHSYRLNVAKDYLKLHPKYSIAHISSILGFSDPLYFSKLFKREYGISPTEFRKDIENKK